MNIKNLVEEKLNKLRLEKQVGDGPGGIQLMWRNDNDFGVIIGDKRYAYEGIGTVDDFLNNLGTGETVDEKMAKIAIASENEEMKSKGLEVTTASKPTVRSLDVYLKNEKITTECSFKNTDRPSKKELYHGDKKIGDIENGNPTLLEEAKEAGYSFEIDENFPKEKLNHLIKEPKKEPVKDGKGVKKLKKKK